MLPACVCDRFKVCRQFVRRLHRQMPLGAMRLACFSQLVAECSGGMAKIVRSNDQPLVSRSALLASALLTSPSWCSFVMAITDRRYVIHLAGLLLCFRICSCDSMLQHEPSRAMYGMGYTRQSDSGTTTGCISWTKSQQATWSGVLPATTAANLTDQAMMSRSDTRQWQMRNALNHAPLTRASEQLNSL